MYQSRESGDRGSVAALAAGTRTGIGDRGPHPRLPVIAAFAARNAAARLISLDSPSVPSFGLVTRSQTSYRWCVERDACIHIVQWNLNRDCREGQRGLQADK